MLSRPLLRFLLFLEKNQQFCSRHPYFRFSLLFIINSYTVLSGPAASSINSTSNSNPNTSTDPPAYTTAQHILIYTLSTAVLIPRSLLISISVPVLITLFFRVLFSVHESRGSALLTILFWAASVYAWSSSRRVKEWGKYGVRGLMVEKARREYAPRLDEVWKKHETGMRRFCGAIAGAGGIGDGLWRDNDTGEDLLHPLKDEEDEEERVQRNGLGAEDRHVWKGLLWALVSTQSETVDVFLNNAREIMAMEKEVLSDVWKTSYELSGGNGSGSNGGISNDTTATHINASKRRKSPPAGSARDIDDGISDDELDGEFGIGAPNNNEAEEQRKRLEKQQRQRELQDGLQSEKGAKLWELTERVGAVWKRLEESAARSHIGEEMGRRQWRDLMWLAEVDSKGIAALDSTLDLEGLEGLEGLEEEEL